MYFEILCKCTVLAFKFNYWITWWQTPYKTTIIGASPMEIYTNIISLILVCMNIIMMQRIFLELNSCWKCLRPCKSVLYCYVTTCTLVAVIKLYVSSFLIKHGNYWNDWKYQCLFFSSTKSHKKKCRKLVLCTNKKRKQKAKRKNVHVGMRLIVKIFAQVLSKDKKCNYKNFKSTRNTSYMSTKTTSIPWELN